ncbi:MAG: BREX system ATP-binding domain-containing protein [Candidatus Cryosericum sp.]
MTEQETCQNIINQLRQGVPPELGVERYSVGHEDLMDGFKKYLLSGARSSGVIRFVSGSWGSGKTHLFRLLRDAAYADGFLVSNVQLTNDETPLSDFGKVFSTIVRQISTPALLDQVLAQENQSPLGDVFEESLRLLGTGDRAAQGPVTVEQYHAASARLAGDRGIDNDLRKIVDLYWQTFLPDADDEVANQRRREDLMQWFDGEGRLSFWQKQYGLMKVPAKDNAKRLLQSLGAFVRLAGYKGIVILFDEAELSYSQMSRTSLRVAQNNLLSLINNLEALAGIVMIYATTPDFYSDLKHGIKTYGALEQRIGQPQDKEPRAVDRVWNIDADVYDMQTYVSVGHKVRNLYGCAFPEAVSQLPSEGKVDAIVRELYDEHNPSSQMSFWRELITTLVATCDDAKEGRPERPTLEIKDDVMSRARDA